MPTRSDVFPRICLETAKMNITLQKEKEKQHSFYGYWDIALKMIKFKD